LIRRRRPRYPATAFTPPTEESVAPQKDALKDIFRNAPLDIRGDPIEQRTNFEKMLSAQPLADDVTATPGELGGVPVLNIETGEARRAATRSCCGFTEAGT
jgi:hypothetical protein